ncbi:MAG: hypothetical protein V3U72_02915, partial [Candidatus Aenigmarchaeota archaeon]
GLVESEWRKGKKYYILKEKRIVDFLRERKPVPARFRPKPPHEIIQDMWEDVSEKLDKIEKRLEKIEKRVK